jgi:hypothetical protein
LVGGPLDDGIGSGMGAVRQCGVLESQGCNADAICRSACYRSGLWVLE